MWILENNVPFGLLYGSVALVVLIWLVFTMNEDGIRFTFNIKKALRERREWNRRRARGELKEQRWGRKR